MELTIYNTNSLLVDYPVGELPSVSEYPAYGAVSTWQGLRYLGENTFLIVGTTSPTPVTGYGLI